MNRLKSLKKLKIIICPKEEPLPDIFKGSADLQTGLSHWKGM